MLHDSPPLFELGLDLGRFAVPQDLLADSDLIETFCENEKDFGRMDRTIKR